MNIAVVLSTQRSISELAPIALSLRRSGERVTVIHTGEHEDEAASARLFLKMGVSPDVHLNRLSGSAGLRNHIQNSEYDLLICNAGVSL